MITQNFKNLLATMLTASPNGSGNSRAFFPMRSVSGGWFYASNIFGVSSSTATYFPNLPSLAAAPYWFNNGISVGSGTTPPTEDDYNLESHLSNVTLSLAAPSYGVDKYYNAYVDFVITVTNTANDPIIVGEVCYKVIVKGAYRPNNSATESIAVMIDRTVLDTPITIQPGDAGTIHYRLQTNSPLGNKKMIGDIPVVSWSQGTDEEVCALIDAARLGLCDLHKDCGWSIGERRTIHLSAFTGGGNTSHAEQDVKIIISSFADYNDCGCVLQFDFDNIIAEKQRVSSSNVAYGNSEMYSTTLPALVNSLPEWLKTRLLTFDVLCAPNATSDPVVVSNNKLALRAICEIVNSTSYAHSLEEGDRVDAYRLNYATSGSSTTSASPINRIAKTFYDANAYYGYVTRTNQNGTYFRISSSNHGSMDSSQNASTANYFAPFGCL